LTFVGDATDSDVIQSVVSQTKAKWNRIDILVNNVGGSIGVKGFDITEEAWDRTIHLNLKSAFLFCKALSPLMREQGSGRIINISSSGGRYRSNTGASNVAYAAAKAAVLQLTRTSAHALGPYGITVNAIAPGLVLSDTGLAELESLAPEVRERVLRETPLGYFAAPAEIASIAVFLASKDASYVTGATILANGGWCTS
jgi:NAD(P)-dependent dehydrogenase (short-subunit alcohol dehydrogenase family)